MVFYAIFLAFVVGVIVGKFFWNELVAAMWVIVVALYKAYDWLARGWDRFKERWAKRVDTLRKKLIVLAVVLFYLLLAFFLLLLLALRETVVPLLAALVLLMLVFYVVCAVFETGDQVVRGGLWFMTAFAVVVALLSKFWNGATGYLTSFLASLGDAWMALLKWLGALLAGVAISLPSCGPTQAPEPVVTPIPERFVVGKSLGPLMRVVNTVTANDGEGCLRITARGGMPLTLAECEALARAYTRLVERHGKFTLAPNVGRNETWYLVVEDGSRWWIIPLKAQKKS